MNLPSVMTAQQRHARVPQVGIQRSTFDRSRGTKTAFDAGYLIPVFLDEVLPGDTVKLKGQIFARLLSPMKTPIMDNISMDVHYFYVPNRILWESWKNFMGEAETSGIATSYVVPGIEIQPDGFDRESIYDYMGIPPEIENNSGRQISALPFRAYNLIFNEWYREQNYQDKVAEKTDNGPDLLSEYTLLRRNKRHDYFTSSLPWPQKGDPVTLSLGTSAPVWGNGMSLGLTDGDRKGSPYEKSGAGLDLSATIQAYNQTNGTVITPGQAFAADAAVGVVEKGQGAGSLNQPDNESGLYADLSDAIGPTINSLREAIATQHLLEMDARGGTRLVELIKVHFGVTVPDFRLQRPEYLGGSTHRINVNPVTQTSQNDAANELYQGKQAAFGTMSGTNGFVKSFVEHGYIIGLASVRADLNYQQGLDKIFTRENRFDFYWPSFAHLGEQAVLQSEIYWTDTVSEDDTVFGYQERYAEYRYARNQITGKMRSRDTDSLDVWHLAEEFDSAPVLNETFIEVDPPLGRVLQLPDEPDVIYDSFYIVSHTRPMPVWSIPGLDRL